MPRVTRNYEHTDFSDLLAELQNPEPQNPFIIEETPRTAQITPPVQKVSEARRRRSRLMDNREMLYAYSKADGILHDRDCPYVQSIKDKDFEMLSSFPTEMVTCRRCYRKAMIRKGIAPDDSKKIDAYLNIFNRLQAYNRSLYILLIENNAKLSDVQLDSVGIEVREDKWLLCCTKNDLYLLHNNYVIMEDNRRYFTDGFHLQNDGGFHTFANYVNIMCHYSWQDHTKSKPLDQT